MELVLTCPNCGKPRRLTVFKGSRLLECDQPGFRSERGCPPAEILPGDMRLTISQMVAVMTASQSIFNDSDKKRTEQTKARRAASTVNTFASSPLLGVDEAATLAAAAEILERLGTAAELAKKELARREKAEELRQADRRAKAGAVLNALALPDDYAAAVPLLLAMQHAEVDHLRVDRFRSVSREVHDATDDRLRNRTVRQVLGSNLISLHRDMLNDLLGSICWRDNPPAADMARGYVEAVQRTMADPAHRAEAAQLVERITTRLVREKLETSNPNAGKEKTQ